MKRLLTRQFFILLALVLFMAILLVIYTNQTVNLTVEESVAIDNEILEVRDTQIGEIRKANDFILAKLPFDNINIEREFSSFNPTHFNEEELQNSAFEMFYSAIKKEDIDFLTTAITPDTFQKLWGEGKSIELREKSLQAYLNSLDRNDQLERISYQLETAAFDTISKKGVMTLHYSDQYSEVIPFSFVQIGENEQMLYQIEF